MKRISSLCVSSKVIENYTKSIFKLAERKEVVIVKKIVDTEKSVKKIRPALTPEARENQLISLATDLVEQRLLDGTASAQETTYFLKQGSLKTKLEMEKLREENQLLKAKTESIHSQKRVEELYMEALNAMRNYAGQGEPDEY